MEPNRTRMTKEMEQEVESLIKRKYRQQEQSLCLSHRPDDWELILNYRDWTPLESLKLMYCNIDSTNISTLTNKVWPNLKKLYLCSSYYLTKHQIKLLVLNQTLHNLTCLNLEKIKIGSEGLKILLRIELHSIIDINLNDCCIGDTGAQHLTKVQWNNLRFLSIYGNHIKIGGLDMIAGMSQWIMPQLLVLKEQKQSTQYIGLLQFATMKQGFKAKISLKDYLKNSLIGRSLCHYTLKRKFDLCHYQWYSYKLTF